MKIIGELYRSLLDKIVADTTLVKERNDIGWRLRQAEDEANNLADAVAELREDRDKIRRELDQYMRDYCGVRDQTSVIEALKKELAEATEVSGERWKRAAKAERHIAEMSQVERDTLKRVNSARPSGEPEMVTIKDLGHGYERLSARLEELEMAARSVTDARAAMCKVGITALDIPAIDRLETMINGPVTS